MLRLDLGKDDRDRLGVLVLEIVGQDLLVHVGELVPHRATRRAAQFFHQVVDLVLRQELHKQPVRLFVGACDGARTGQPVDEVLDQHLDGLGFHRAKVRHCPRDFSEFLVIEAIPDRLGFLAQRQQQDGGLFRAVQRTDGVQRLGDATLEVVHVFRRGCWPSVRRFDLLHCGG